MQIIKDDNLLIMIPQLGDNPLELQEQGSETARTHPGISIIADMEAFDSGGSPLIRFMLAMHQQTRRQGAQFVACNLSPQMVRVLQTAHIDQALRLCADREEALSLLKTV